jgi:hypothetical protein
MNRCIHEEVSYSICGLQRRNRLRMHHEQADGSSALQWPARAWCQSKLHELIAVFNLQALYFRRFR